MLDSTDLALVHRRCGLEKKVEEGQLAPVSEGCRHMKQTRINVLLTIGCAVMHTTGPEHYDPPLVSSISDL